MSIGVRDARLSKGAASALANTRRLECEGNAAQIRDAIVGEVEPIFAAFGEAVAQEDQSETSLGLAGKRVDRAQEQAFRAFRAMHSGLNTGVAFQMTDDEATSEELRTLEAYLNKMTPGEFRRLSQAELLVQFERTYNYLGEFLPEALETKLRPLAEDALSSLRSAAEEREASNADWVQEQTELEIARTRTLDAYLALRDAMSAALRLVGSHDRLNQLVPPLSRVIDAPPGDSGDEPAQPVAPTPAEDEEPVA